jgi:hypothetical protein
METVLSSIVLVGQGFTPQVFTPKALQGTFHEEPDIATASATLALVQYPSGYQVLIQPHRIEVKRRRPPAGGDKLMQDAALKLSSLWPLVEPQAVGVNFIFADPTMTADRRRAIRRGLVDEPRVVDVLGSELLGASFTFVSELHGAKVSVSVDPEAMEEEREVFGFRLNVHYEPVEDVAAAWTSQESWHQRALTWGERFTDGA